MKLLWPKVSAKFLKIYHRAEHISFSPSPLPSGHWLHLRKHDFPAACFPKSSQKEQKAELSQLVTKDASDETSTAEMFCSLWLMFWLSPLFQGLAKQNPNIVAVFLPDCRMKLILIFWCGADRASFLCESLSVALILYLTSSTDNKMTHFVLGTFSYEEVSQKFTFCSFNKISKVFQWWILYTQEAKQKPCQN